MVNIYLYNWTNGQEFMEDYSVKPIFNEIGPYRYRENATKVEIRFHTNNGTVSFKKQNFYHFLKNSATGNMDDLITMINAISLVCIPKTLFLLPFSTKIFLSYFSLCLLKQSTGLLKT